MANVTHLQLGGQMRELTPQDGINSSVAASERGSSKEMTSQFKGTARFDWRAGVFPAPWLADISLHFGSPAFCRPSTQLAKSFGRRNGLSSSRQETVSEGSASRRCPISSPTFARFPARAWLGGPSRIAGRKLAFALLAFSAHEPASS